MLVKGHGTVYYADQVVEVKKQALPFSNPLIPYKWEHHEELTGQYCIFNQHFVSRFGDIMQYEIFQPTGNHIFELTTEQTISKFYFKKWKKTSNRITSTNTTVSATIFLN